MDETEKQLGLDRVREWPRPEIDWAAELTGKEQTFLVEAAALLDIEPLDELGQKRLDRAAADGRVIEIP